MIRIASGGGAGAGRGRLEGAILDQGRPGLPRQADKTEEGQGQKRHAASDARYAAPFLFQFHVLVPFLTDCQELHQPKVSASEKSCLLHTRSVYKTKNWNKI